MYKWNILKKKVEITCNHNLVQWKASPPSVCTREKCLAVESFSWQTLKNALHVAKNNVYYQQIDLRLKDNNTKTDKTHKQTESAPSIHSFVC